MDLASGAPPGLFSLFPSPPLLVLAHRTSAINSTADTSLPTLISSVLLALQNGHKASNLHAALHDILISGLGHAVIALDAEPPVPP